MKKKKLRKLIRSQIKVVLDAYMPVDRLYGILIPGIRKIAQQEIINASNKNT